MDSSQFNGRGSSGLAGDASASGRPGDTNAGVNPVPGFL